MGLYVIGDLHLSGSVEKPMDVFGMQWVEHQEKIEKNWKETIGSEDMVLIPGDISWAMRLEEAIVDLQWIQKLPGKKVLLKGNHDYWWSSITKLNSLFPNMIFLQNDYVSYEDYAICGTRGWTCPNPYKFDSQDEKIYNRELQRLKLSLDKGLEEGFKKIIVMLHYPPTNDLKEPSEFTQLIQRYPVEKVVYGHLHGKEGFEAGLKGEHRGIIYYLTSCDYLDFVPIQILE
ncbi:MAG: metallophosphoesterase [Thermotaleaceae bacterium]